MRRAYASRFAVAAALAVTDPAGLMMPGAKVTIVQNETNGKSAVATDHLGNYSPLKPFSMDPRGGGPYGVDLSRLLDAPAGKHGFVRVQDGRLVAGNGRRIRFWGVNVTDFDDGSTMIPAKEDAADWARALARFGVNCVRLHHIDRQSPNSIIDWSRDDTRSFNPVQLDRLDYWIAELKKLGIYVNLNLNVGRSYKSGDGVAEYAILGLAKALTMFDPRLIELQKEYARLLLTHVNPYTRAEYRNEPAIAIVELLNENSIVHAWHFDRLRGTKTAPPAETWQDIPPTYARYLDRRYNEWPARAAPAPRLTRSEFATAPNRRFHAEAAFYMGLEDAYYDDMRTFLRGLGVKVPLVGSSEHAGGMAPYPVVRATSRLDIVDAHRYWQAPRWTVDPRTGKRQKAGSLNTPMVNEPLSSNVVALSRGAMEGKPFTVSEVNNPRPSDYTAEGIPLIAAYAALQDWDAVFFYTFEPKPAAIHAAALRTHDLSHDPVKLPQMAAGALMFLRGGVTAARQTATRSYTREQVIETLRAADRARPYYTPGFPVSLALKHRIRIESLEAAEAKTPRGVDENPIASDTGELEWRVAKSGRGVVTIDGARTQGVVGFLKEQRRPLKHLDLEADNTFASVLLTSLDERPLAQSARMLLTAGGRAENTGMRWNADRTQVLDWGTPPTLIEVVTGRIVLRGLGGARQVTAFPLDGAGKRVGKPQTAQRAGERYSIPLGERATTWYEIVVER